MGEPMGTDANKTKETKLITDLSAQWLLKRGFRTVETEVQVKRGWVADVAGSQDSITRSNAYKLRMISYLNDHTSFRILPDRVWTAIIEVKTSRSDLTRDRKWGCQVLPAHFTYVAVTPNLIDVAEAHVPIDWGILTKRGSNEYLSVHRFCYGTFRTIRDVDKFVQAIAVRRDNATAYARHREWERQHREHNNDRTNKIRISRVTSMLMDVVEGKCDIDTALMMNGLKGRNIPAFIRGRIDKLKEVVHHSKGVNQG